MENVGTIFNIVLSSANKGEKYEVGVWLDKILPSSKKWIFLQNTPLNYLTENSLYDCHKPHFIVLY